MFFVYLITILVFAGVAVFLAWPYWSRSTMRQTFTVNGTGVRRLREMREEKAKFLLALRELDFDYETAKLSKEDYQSMRQKYENKAIEVFKELEALESQWAEMQKTIDQELEIRARSHAS